MSTSLPILRLIIINSLTTHLSTLARVPGSSRALDSVSYSVIPDEEEGVDLEQREYLYVLDDHQVPTVSTKSIQKLPGTIQSDSEFSTSVISHQGQHEVMPAC